MDNSTTCKDAAGKAKECAGQLGEKAQEVWHDAQESLGAAKEAASGCIRQGREKVEALGRAVEGKVKEWPLSALLVAAGVGVLVGVVVARR